jgi:GxxExxY protein
MKHDDLTTRLSASPTKFITFWVRVFSKVFMRTLRIELERVGVAVMQQEKLKVCYEDHVVGDYVPDLWIADRLIIEVKAVLTLSKEHEVQLVNYLTATRIDDGLLLNFGPSA